VRKEIIISGQGGQGIVLAGRILANILFTEGYEVIQTQSYGSEARGGACKSEIIVSDMYIYDISMSCPEFIVTMSSQAYNRLSSKVIKGGALIVDSTLVRKTKPRPDVSFYKVPATKIAAETMKHKIVANMILLGFLLEKLGFVKLGNAKNVISHEISAPIKDINILALEKGWKIASND
jgi:2-oxoglutarate ferredoxin oxidoreductase subunit gamma